MYFTRKGAFCSLLILASFLVLNTSPGYAQTTATVTGTVADATAAVIPGVTVIANNLDTGASRTAVSDDLGRYKITNLPVGNYEVRAELVGFSTQVRSGIQLTVGQEAVIDLTLTVGEISEVISVTGEAPIINTTQATVSGLVDSQKIRDLPLNQRNLLALVPLYTGAAFAETGATSVSKGYGTKLAIGGTRYNANSFLLDGTDIRDLAGSGGSAAGILMGVETVREFNVITNAFSAEYGNHTGGVFNAVTKSGTNQIHGSVFEFHRNDNLDAALWEDNKFGEEKPEFKRNQFGGVIGGPIVPDQTFFFFSYEGLREDRGQTQLFQVPSLEARDGNLPGLAPIDPDADVKLWLDAYPEPNGDDLGDGTADFIRSTARTVEEDYLSARIDHQLSDANTFFGRYTWDDAIRSNPNDIATILEDLTTNQYLTLEDTHVFSTAVVNRFMAGATRTDLRTAVPLFPGINLPQLTFTGRRPLGQTGIFTVDGIDDLGGQSTNPRLGAQNTFQFKDDISYQRGNHSLKFGGEFTRYQLTHGTPFHGAGQYDFDSLEEALNGEVGELQALLPSTDLPYYIRQSYAGFYLQDDIKVRPNLSLNLGLRWEFVTTPTEKDGRLANARDYVTPGLTLADMVTGDPYYDNPSYDSFAPRVGIAWNPWGDGKTSVRIGVGTFFDHIMPGKWNFGFDANAPFFERGRLRDKDLPAGVEFDFPNGFFTHADLLGSRLQVEGIEFNPKQPVVYKWSLEIQREIAANTSVDIGYSATRGVHLMRVESFNNPFPYTLQDGRIFVAKGLPDLSPEMGRIRPRFLDVESDYHAFNLSVNRRFSQGLQFQASYTTSKVVADRDNWTGSSDWGNSGQGCGSSSRAAIPPFMFMKLDRGLACFDVRKNFFFNATWDLPVGTGQAVDLAGAANHILGGWTVTTIVRLTDGNPFGPSVGSSSIFGRDRGNGLDLAPGADPNPVDARNTERYFDPSSFQLPLNSAGDFDKGLIGNLARNTIIAPGVASVDLMLGKEVAIPSVSEEVKIQFRSEFFNLFNRPNFDTPSTGIFNDDKSIAATAGRITDTRTSAREIQFGLKILW